MTTSKHKLIVVAGPTGSGKTDLSIQLAQYINAPILSTDSRQVFRGMAIGTAQPSPAQLAQAEHHLIANRDITEPYTAGHYEREALEVLDRLFATHRAVIAVGGSGLYIDALCEGMDQLPDADPALRAELEVRWEESREELLAELQQLDPVYYTQVDRANPKRVIRALEVCRKSGLPYSTLRSGSKQQRPFNILKIGVTLPREELYARIDRRVDQMIEDGLLDETRALFPFRELNALQTVGYRELFEHFDGRISLPEAIELIKRNSRRYAKRQMTWFTKDDSIHWFAPTDTEGIERLVDDFLQK